MRADLRSRHPELWQGFCALARADERTSPYWDTIAAVDPELPRQVDAEVQTGFLDEPSAAPASPTLSVSTSMQRAGTA